MAASKSKVSFKLQGVNYTDIANNQYWGTNGPKYNIGLAGTGQMIRQWIKAKYPKINANSKVWVRTRSFANGDAVDIYFDRIPADIFKEIDSELHDIFEEYDGHRYEKKLRNKTDDGESLSFGIKYVHVSNKPPYGEPDTPAPDWEKILAGGTGAATQKSGGSKTGRFQKQPEGWYGELIAQCRTGWLIYGKTLPDGRVVSSIVKGKEVVPNKTEWGSILGDLSVLVGYKWRKSGQVFERWATLPEDPIQLRDFISNVCGILDKYYPTVTHFVYKGVEPNQQPNIHSPAPAPVISEDRQKLMAAISKLTPLANAGNAMAQRKVLELQSILDKTN